MTAKTPQFGHDDKTAADRRDDLSEDEIKQLDLAGGVEGGMQAGSAGGPGQAEHEKPEHEKVEREEAGDAGKPDKSKAE